MRIRSILGCTFLLITLPCFAGSHSRRGPTAHRASEHGSRRIFTRAASKPIGQRTIDDARASQFQAALTNAGYLSGSSSGHWDAETEAAMQKFQADHGWQTKLIPDSRAIIKLGLGPNGSEQASTDSHAAASPLSF